MRLAHALISLQKNDSISKIVCEVRLHCGQFKLSCTSPDLSSSPILPTTASTTNDGNSAIATSAPPCSTLEIHLSNSNCLPEVTSDNSTRSRLFGKRKLNS